MRAIVIGGTSGFGKNISDALREKDYVVTTIGRADGDFVSDVGDEQQWKETLEQLAHYQTPASLVVFVAGFARPNKDGHDDRSWLEHEQKNLGYVRQALEKLPFAEHARIATIGSQWSWKRGMEELAPYIEAKHALRDLTEEFAKKHPAFSVSHLCPPTMRTEQLKRVLEIGYSPAHGIADPEVIAKSMVRQMVTREFSGETLQFDNEGEFIQITGKEVQTEPRYPRPMKK